VGATISAIGNQLSIVAVAFEVYRLTRSDFDVGLISLVELVPSFVGCILGGGIADAMDRRKVLIVTGTVMAVAAAGMAVDVGRPHPSLILLYVLAAVAAGFQGANNPAQTAGMLTAVARVDVVKANVLRQLSNQSSIVAGAALGGLVIGWFGVATALWVNTVSFGAVVGAALAVGDQRPMGVTRFGWRSINEGFSFLRERQALRGVFIADLNVTVFGWPTSLFPAIALTHFHGGASVVGLLYATPGIGACIGGGLSGWAHRIQRPGLAICIGSCVWGLAIALFGVVPWMPLAVALLGLAGALDTICTVFRTAIIQDEMPDRMRGRLSSLQMALMGNGPRLGNTEAGLVAAATSTELSVISGGIATILGIAVVARQLPQFFQYRVGLHAAAEDTPA
jgi:MFS family permease